MCEAQLEKTNKDLAYRGLIFHGTQISSYVSAYFSAEDNKTISFHFIISVSSN